MNAIIPTSFRHCPVSQLGAAFSGPTHTLFRAKTIRIHANSNEADMQTVEERTEEDPQANGSSSAPAFDKDIKKVGFSISISCFSD